MSRRSRAVCGWAPAAFFTLQALLVAAIDSHPVLRDPEFGQKLARLQELLAAQPDRPLLLIVGSSRSSSGIQPSAVRLLDLDPVRRPLIFNFALTGCGPIQQLQLLDRLHRENIRPRWILAEIHPLLLHQEPRIWGEEQWMRPESLDWHDLSSVSRYLSRPAEWRWRWAQLRVAPAYSYRFQLLNVCMPGWLDTSRRQDAAWRDLDAWGWLPLVCSNDKASNARRRRQARQQYGPAFHDFRVTSAADGALREFIAAAERRGMAVGLYLMPEGDAFRSWYSPAAREKIEHYLAAVSRDAGAPVFDATSWCAEGDFSDSHHLLAGASLAFSRRFGEEIAATFLAECGGCGRQKPPRRVSRAKPPGSLAAPYSGR